MPDDLLDKAPGLLQELREGGPISKMGEETVELIECLGLLGTKRDIGFESWGALIEPHGRFLSNECDESNKDGDEDGDGDEDFSAGEGEDEDGDEDN